MKKELFIAVCLLTLTILPARPAPAAIDFTLILNENDTEYPDFDSDCSGLTALFEEAARRYENILMDTHPLTINYWYEDLSGNSRYEYRQRLRH
jgi:hypothetical protein